MKYPPVTRAPAWSRRQALRLTGALAGAAALAGEATLAAPAHASPSPTGGLPEISLFV